MTCTRCQREHPDDARYCLECGAATAQTSTAQRRLTRARSADAWIGGVCAGLANYVNVDPVFVRAAWVVLSVVPGMFVGGLVAYFIAWLLIPADEPRTDSRSAEGATHSRRPLLRSTRDRRIAGVCGGLADYFSVDATPIRALWIILTVVPGAIVGGVLLYLLAWLLIPRASELPTSPTLA